MAAGRNDPQATDTAPPATAMATATVRACVVHIGLNKTGSNAIHTWLARNAQVLRRRGVWFDPLPPHGGPDLSTATGWVFLARSSDAAWMPGPADAQIFRITDRASLDARIATFLARAEASLPDGAGTYVTSAEMIGSLESPALIERLHRWFADRFDDVRYVVYLRDQVDWVPSAYGQAVRAGATLGLDAFIEQSGRNDYFDLVRRWQSVVGAGSLDVRLYGSRAFAGGDLIEDFATALGTATAGTMKPPRRNQAMSVQRLHATLWANRALGGLVRAAGLLPLQIRLNAAPLPQIVGTRRKLRLSPDQARRVRAMNADANERLRAALFPERPTLFSPAPAAATAPGPTTELSHVTGP